ncbi:CYTH and CHAD domain-containing protein [Mycobacterium sp. SM1]|uniref:CYTH and CHAD domain-containing protein n=1 Tax=Mycobacterium sp. SM1 TaxID=2816243 RepID=UPI001BCB5660|nr:CYTH and CHAD domain-containing protein [Mycobacterium sp. SM1]MBS4730193.1 CYTH and CHAD domain-containing protein [Mycobacterium sp. SM1]
MPVKAPKTPGYLEVERKYDVAEAAVVPSFDGLTPVVRVEKPPTQELDAVYFDTPGRDLASKRITLRRRTGGSDAGWHLKLPAGPDARTEVRAPLGAADGADQTHIPAELLDVVLAIVRDRPLEPVARITTRRERWLLRGADDAVRAEFCDDHVTAWPAAPTGEVPAEHRWREWEVELAAPGTVAGTELLDQLGNRLLTAGATPAGHSSKLARVLGPMPSPDGSRSAAAPVRRAVAEQIEQLLVWDRAVRAGADDAVHQMRVTLRKLRSLLQASPAEFGVPDNAPILDELRDFALVLSEARDAEVLGERYQRALDRLPPELARGRVRERLVDGSRHRYQEGLQRSLTAMRSERYFRMLDALDAIVSQPRAPGRGQPAPATIRAAYKRVRKAAKAAALATGEDHNLALHRIRKRAKRLRYTAAALGALQVSERAKAIQTLLGDHQDSVISRNHLRQQADAAFAAGEDTFTYGLLYQQEADVADRCRRQLSDALDDLAKAMRHTKR